MSVGTKDTYHINSSRRTHDLGKKIKIKDVLKILRKK